MSPQNPLSLWTKHLEEAWTLSWRRLGRARIQALLTIPILAAAVVTAVVSGTSIFFLSSFFMPLVATVVFLMRRFLDETCPRCGERFFARYYPLSLHRCQSCGIAIGEFPHEIHTARLRWLVGDRPMRVVDSRTLEGEERGIRVGIAQPASGRARTILDADALLLSGHDVERLRAQV